MVCTPMACRVGLLAFVSSGVLGSGAKESCSHERATGNTLIQKNTKLQRRALEPSTSLHAISDQQAPRQQVAKPETVANSSSQQSLIQTRVDGVMYIPPVVIILALTASELPCVAKVSPVRGWSFNKRVELVAALMLYMISGPAVVILDKYIMREHRFSFPILLASLGNVVLTVVTHCAVATGLHKVEVPKMEMRRFFRLVVPMVCLNFASQVTGVWAYLFVSLPLTQILKSATVVVVCILAYFIVNEPLSFKLVIGVLIIAAGNALCACFDQGAGQSATHTAIASVIGVMLCLVASCCEAGKAVSCQVIMESLNIFDNMYWSGPLFALLTCVFVAAIELKGIVHYPFTRPLVGLLLLDAALTSLVVLSNLWLTKLIGALSLKVLAQARTIGLVLVAVCFFHESCSSMQYLGYTLTLIGMWIFSKAKQALREAAHGGQPPRKAHEGVQDTANEGQPAGKAYDGVQEFANEGQPAGKAYDGVQEFANESQPPGKAHEGVQEAANENQPPGMAQDGAHETADEGQPTGNAHEDVQEAATEGQPPGKARDAWATFV